VIPTRFPAVNLFDRVASPGDFDALYALEAMTNDRLRTEVGELDLVPPDERCFGPGCGPIMAAFTHLNPNGSRFSDGSYGVFYCARGRQTAIAETRYHRERFMRATRQARCELDMRVLTVTVKAELHDLRRMRDILPDIYRADDYTASQILGGALRAGGSNGVVYDSVRHDGGKCVGIFRPRTLAHCREAKHLRYIWNGTSIDNVLEVRRML